jgi:hypothetical protein
VRGLAADGTRLALSLESTGRSCQHVELWDERTGAVTSFHNSAYSCREIEGSAFAGARVAWRIVDPGGNSTGFSLLTATAARPRPRTIAEAATDEGHSTGDFIGRPLGHGSLLLLNRWHVCQTYGRKFEDWCAGRHPRNTLRIDRASLQRFAGGRLRTLRRGLATLRVAATDGRVTAILERDGSISLLRANGTLAGRFKLPGERVRAVALARETLLVEAGRAIHLFDRRSGAEERTLAVPRGAKLVDAEGSLAVAIAGTSVVVSALNRRAQFVIRTGGHSPVRAQIERAGLWYSFTTGKNRGRVVFVPMRRIGLKLRPR